MCDEILLNKSSTNTTIAINWLHIIKAHPEYLKKYIYVSSYIYTKLFFNIIKRIISYYLYFIKNCFYKKSNLKDKKIIIIIISHLLNINQIREKKDLYFGNLQGILNKKKISSLRILINHTKISSNKLNVSLKNKNNIVMSKYLNFFDEIKIFLYQVKDFGL